MKAESSVVMRRLIIAWGVFGLVLLFSTCLSADLSNTRQEIIRIAYMNGCARVLSSDIEEIKYLKQSTDRMRRYVEAETIRYMRQVAYLNSDEYKRKSAQKATTALRHRNPNNTIHRSQSLQKPVGLYYR